jgi:hypothetical protein
LVVAFVGAVTASINSQFVYFVIIKKYFPLNNNKNEKVNYESEKGKIK